MSFFGGITHAISTGWNDLFGNNNSTTVTTTTTQALQPVKTAQLGKVQNNNQQDTALAPANNLNLNSLNGTLQKFDPNQFIKANPAPQPSPPPPPQSNSPSLWQKVTHNPVTNFVGKNVVKPVAATDKYIANFLGLPQAVTINNPLASSEDKLKALKAVGTGLVKFPIQAGEQLGNTINRAIGASDVYPEILQKTGVNAPSLQTQFQETKKTHGTLPAVLETGLSAASDVLPFLGLNKLKGGETIPAGSDNLTKAEIADGVSSVNPDQPAPITEPTPTNAPIPNESAPVTPPVVTPPTVEPPSTPATLPVPPPESIPTNAPELSEPPSISGPPNTPAYKRGFGETLTQTTPPELTPQDNYLAEQSAARKAGSIPGQVYDAGLDPNNPIDSIPAFQRRGATVSSDVAAQVADLHKQLDTIPTPSEEQSNIFSLKQKYGQMLRDNPTDAPAIRQHLAEVTQSIKDNAVTRDAIQAKIDSLVPGTNDVSSVVPSPTNEPTVPSNAPEAPTLPSPPATPINPPEVVPGGASEVPVTPAVAAEVAKTGADSTIPTEWPTSTERPKGFVDTVATGPDQTAAGVAGGIEPQNYQALPNQPGLDAADAFIKENGADAAHAAVTDVQTPFDANKSALGQKLMKQYAADNNIPKLEEVINSMDQQARVAGQGVQMLSNWDKLSPESVYKLANSEAEKIGVTLSDSVKQSVLDQMKEVQKLPEGSPERDAAMQGVLKFVAEQLPTSKSEWINNYRYQNMLSSPTPVLKIGTSGAFNTLITHPVDLFSRAAIDTLHKGASIISGTPYDRSVAFSDIPVYYKNVLQGLPDAWQGAVESFKSGNLDKTFEEGRAGSSTIGDLRQQNIPAVLRPFTALHGAIYNYFQALVTGGEKARLMEHGMDETEAAQAASALGDKLTLREPLGSKEGGALVRGLDAMGKAVSNLEKGDNVAGGAMKWVAPFMRVSTNWAKLAVEHSPLNLIDSPANLTADHFAKAFTGSVATGIGLTYAMRGDVTLAPPIDPTQQNLFYASGRKPYSVHIGGHWVPMAYLGPFAISFALPQAVKEASSGTNANSDVFTKVARTASNISQDVLASTPLPAVVGFFNLLNGEGTAPNIAKIGADLTSQTIPLAALLRYTANVTDPIYRQSKTFVQRIESGIPGLSKNNAPYVDPTGQPEKRNASNFVAPYAIGNDSGQFDAPFKARQQTLNSNAIVNSANKGNNTKLGAGFQQVGDNIWKLPDGTFSYKIDNTFSKAKTQADAQTAVDKNAYDKSGKTDPTLINGNYFSKDKNGKVHTQSQNDHDYQQLTDAYSIGSSTLSDQKAADDINGWMATAQAQLKNIQTQLINPNTKPTDAARLKSAEQTLVNEMAKYKSYGGFTKGSGGGTTSNTLGSPAALAKIDLSGLAPQKITNATIPTIQQIQAGDLIKKRTISVGKAV